jgi:S-adenosylmethionine synthetase
MSHYLFTSESVTEGHPDKVADRISDTILDAFLKEDPYARVACETLVTTGLVVLAGEVSTRSQNTLNFQKLVRDSIADIGYDDSSQGFSANSCSVLNALHEQSADIAQGVDRGEDIGAGDQGMMFGYANNETPEYMPLCISLAHRLTKRLADLRKSGEIAWLGPDGKAQVTVEYEDGKAKRVHTVVLSTQHAESVSQKEITETVKKKIIEPVLPAGLIQGEPVYHINPTGKFVIGGPHGDSGLTGRKIIVDTYGGYAPHGGGAFSGKDPTKVDRSAAYMARYVAKNIVAAGLASRAQIQLSYAIGVADPVSVHLDTYGTSQVDPVKLLKVVRELFPMSPAGIIKALDLRRPIYAQTAAYGHFGRADVVFPWEKTDKADALKRQF